MSFNTGIAHYIDFAIRYICLLDHLRFIFCGANSCVTGRCHQNSTGVASNTNETDANTNCNTKENKRFVIVIDEGSDYLLYQVCTLEKTQQRNTNIKAQRAKADLFEHEHQMAERRESFSFSSKRSSFARRCTNTPVEYRTQKKKV